MEVNAKKFKITITDVERKEIAGVEKFLHNLNVQMDNEVRRHTSLHFYSSFTVVIQILNKYFVLVILGEN